MKETLILVAEVSSLFGHDGWVKIKPFTTDPSNLLAYRPWYIKKSSNLKKIPSSVIQYDEANKAVKGFEQVKVSDAKCHNQLILAKINDVVDTNLARLFIHSEIYVPKSEFPEDKSAYYWIDLIGLDVIDQHNQTLGVVATLMETGAHDVLVINKRETQHQNREDKINQDSLLIPFVEGHFVTKVDLINNIICVNWEANYL